MKKLLLSIGVCTYLCATAASAQALISPTVSSIKMGWGGEGVYFQVTPAVTSQGCATTSEIVLSSSHIRFKESLAIVLAGVTAGKTQDIWVQGCFNGRPNILGVGFLN